MLHGYRQLYSLHKNFFKTFTHTFKKMLKQYLTLKLSIR